MATLLLNHFNGSDGATTFTDEVGGITWSRPEGSTQLDTAVAKFGASSLLLPNGGAEVTATGFPDVNSGSYTLEGWVYVSSTSHTGFAMKVFDAGTSRRAQISVSPHTAQVGLLCEDDSTEYIDQSAAATISTSTWYHWALVRDSAGGTYSAFFNGSRFINVSNGTNPGSLVDVSLGTATIYDGWLDEVRLTNEVKYSGSTYTVPSGEFSAAITPVAAFSATPTSGFESLAINFTDASANTPTSWLWERKTTGAYSTFSTSQNPSVSWDAGIYDVKLTATNAAGSDAEEKLDYISIAAVFAPAAETVGTISEAGLTTEILLAAADTVTATDSVSLNTGTEMLVGEDTVATTDSAALTTAILMESTDTATTGDTATLTVPVTIVIVPPSGGAHAQDDLNVGGVDKPAIPPTTDLPLAIIRILDPMKQNIEIITGRRGGRIEMLGDDATLEQVAEKVNQLVARLMQ